MFTNYENGQTIACEISGKGPPFLLLHGFSQTMHMWDELVPHLEETHTVLRMDLRGCGGSVSPTDPDAYSVEHHVADVNAVLHAAGVDAYSVWGWSFGATLGLHLAARGERISRAVLAGTRFGRVFTPEWVEPRAVRMEQWAALKRESRLDELRDASGPHYDQLMTLEATAARTRGLLSWPAINPDDLRCPALIYSGTEDVAVIERLRAQRAAIEETGHRFHVFEGVGHAGLFTQTVLPLVQSFLI